MSLASPAEPGPGTGLCARCLGAGQVHRAWAVVQGWSLCIRHVSEALHPDDQMGEADLTAAVYERLRALGVPDAY